MQTTTDKKKINQLPGTLESFFHIKSTIYDPYFLAAADPRNAMRFKKKKGKKQDRKSCILNGVFVGTVY